MQEFIQALMSPGSWTQTQWLALGIAIFLLVASVYFVFKLLQIIRDAGKSSYKPNIGMARIQAEKERQEQSDESQPEGERSRSEGH